MGSHPTINGSPSSNPKRPRPSSPIPQESSIPSTPITPSEIASEFSHHDPTIARINNGSFGSVPKSILQSQSHQQLLFLRQPDHFYFNLLQPSILKSRTLLSEIVNSPSPHHLSLVDNATTAAAIVLQSISRAFSENKYPKGDSVLMLHYAYGAVKKSIHAYVARAGAHVIEVPLPFPVYSNDDIIREFRNAIVLGKADGRRIRLAVIDHVTSMPSVVIPVKELVRICRDEGVDQVFVDAAHAIGNVEVDMQDIGADFYTSNLHKWFFCPPSVAFLYTRKKAEEESDLHHPVVSHEYGNGLPLESGWIGTRDYSPQLVVPEVLKFVERFEGGIAGIRRRNHEKVVEMGKMLAEAWGTFLGCPPEMSCSMIMVGLPVCLEVGSEKEALTLRTLLREEYKVEVPIHYQAPRESDDDKGNVTGFVRISHQVYNVEDDYIRLRDAVLKLVDEGFNCKMLPTK